VAAVADSHFYRLRMKLERGSVAQQAPAVWFPWSRGGRNLHHERCFCTAQKRSIFAPTIWDGPFRPSQCVENQI